MATTIRIYLEATAEVPSAQHVFNLSDFGGQLPAPGDLILDPSTPPTAEAVTVWEVVARYHDPGRGFDADACLRVQARARAATLAEAAFFNDG